MFEPTERPCAAVVVILAGPAAVPPPEIARPETVFV